MSNDTTFALSALSNHKSEEHLYEKHNGRIRQVNAPSLCNIGDRTSIPCDTVNKK